MSKIDNGGPAFPTKDNNRYHLGMTLRDYFAVIAMQGAIASLQEGEDFNDRGAEWAYKVADAMLKARKGEL